MKTVVITGAGRGIGLATAKKFLDEGWFVFALVRGEMPVTYERMKIVRYDQTFFASIEQSIHEISRVDVVVNNAACLFDRDEMKIDLEKLRQTLEVNLIGVIDFTERIISKINPGGYIVNISSRSGALGEDVADDDPDKSDAPAYRISKAALNMYTRTLADRLRDTDITVLSFDPGWVRTDMTSAAADRDAAEPAIEIFELVNKKIPSGKFWRKGIVRNW